MGDPGTGKTLAGSIAAKLASDNGWTFIEVVDSDQLSRIMLLAEHYYSPAIVFCEDIDMIAKGARTVSVNDIVQPDITAQGPEDAHQPFSKERARCVSFLFPPRLPLRA